MAVFDPTQFAPARNVFPELTNVQFETAALHAVGLSQKEISDLRHVSVKCVQGVLNIAKDKFGVSSLATLRSVFLIRIFLYSIQPKVRRR